MRTNENKSADAPPLTRSVAQFAASTRYEDIPSDVIALSRKAVLDRLGLAFAGSVAEGTILLRRHIASHWDASAAAARYLDRTCVMHARFAALANGTAMHSDDYVRHAQSKPHTSLCIGGGSIVRRGRCRKLFRAGRAGGVQRGCRGELQDQHRDGRCTLRARFSFERHDRRLRCNRRDMQFTGVARRM